MPIADMEPVTGNAHLQQGAVRELAQLFKLLSDETRLRILHYLLSQDELHVRALCDLLEQSQPAVSHHLALLRVANLIESRRDGKHNFYRVISPKVKELVGKLNDFSPAIRTTLEEFSGNTEDV